MPEPWERVAIFVDKPDWHCRRLVAAFADRGVEAVPVAMAACAFDTGSEPGLGLPEFPDHLPAAAFVRCLPGGSFEQVTLRLGLLHLLRAAGVRVCNDARAIECCVDKSMTSMLLQSAGLATPRTWVVQGLAPARSLVARHASADAPLVLKPLFGSQGRGLGLIHGPHDLPSEEDALAGVYYLQDYVAGDAQGWRDLRVLVAGGEVIGTMLRRGVSWVTNAHQGAHCERHAPSPAVARLALQAVRAVGADYAGVDIIHDPQGRPLVLEVNSMPAWSALQRVHDHDITLAMVDALCASGFATDRTLPRVAGAAGGS